MFAPSVIEDFNKRLNGDRTINGDDINDVDGAAVDLDGEEITMYKPAFKKAAMGAVLNDVDGAPLSDPTAAPNPIKVAMRR